MTTLEDNRLIADKCGYTYATDGIEIFKRDKKLTEFIDTIFHPDKDPAQLFQCIEALAKKQKIHGQHDPEAEYFVLRVDGKGSDRIHIHACRQALAKYCNVLRKEGHLLELADDLEKRYNLLDL